MRTDWVCFDLSSAEVSNRIKSKSEWNKKWNKSVRVDEIYELIERKYIVIAVLGQLLQCFLRFSLSAALSGLSYFQLSLFYFDIACLCVEHLFSASKLLGERTSNLHEYKCALREAIKCSSTIFARFKYIQIRYEYALFTYAHNPVCDEIKTQMKRQYSRESA